MTTTPVPDARRETETADADDAEPEAPLETDVVFHLLQTRRRQLALHYLHGQEGPVRMRDLAEQVTAWENDTTVREITSDQRQRVYIPLYQTHLPKLDDAGVIEYDQSRGVVEPTERIHQLYPYLGYGASGSADRDDGSCRRTPDPTAYFGGATLLSGGLLLGSMSGLLALSGAVVGTLIALLYPALTLGFRWQSANRPTPTA